ncbi:MAG: chemotaxis protein MotB [Gemmatimonadota bacterium]|nr:MAG: chemotaxis protein MotB [Gemmatimonadota bacterium]
MADDELEEEEEEGGAPGWLTTWADMMSVLLTFFIVLQAFSTLSEKKFYEAMSSIQRAFHMPLPIKAPGSFTYETPRTAEEMEEQLDKDTEGISVEDFGDRIVLTVESGMLFGIGRAEMTSTGASIMDQVAKAIARAPGPIRVEGHTCDLPVGAGSEFRDNWELSTGRALSVLQELTRRGIRPERLAASGHGEFHPIAPNDTEENRRKNRRVEFVIEKGPEVADDFGGGG